VGEEGTRKPGQAAARGGAASAAIPPSLPALGLGCLSSERGAAQG